MALQYYPKEGEILVCDYTGFSAPEMTKSRPVIIVSPRLRRRSDLVTVVPLSTTAPQTIEDYHFRIELAVPLPPPFGAPEMWAKCDMISTVALTRLDRFKSVRRPHGGARTWLSGQLTKPQILAVKRSLLCGLGLSSLTVHL
ncbi:hypothetical protein HH800_01910 [Sphingobium yanoikuyae]|uniref:Type II toxin-antitoxin system PemK/MazF family toxin n=1 Tax=Sphingobium yanoikuyae TaxID=13690 RepID=A0A6M4G2E6_SPHYA|nr:type II toxin-antitoxin system PemK/MazF family toxin [Sphingobium yanoikuyae]QJR01060.1 hypothetical protein HH800_01910 [Sphingobium yanoikuyae]